MQDCPEVHDCEIYSYEVNIESQTLCLHTNSGFDEEKKIDILFTNVLAHYFEDVFTQNVISDIYEPGIKKYMEEYSNMTRKKKHYWPIPHESENDLYNILINNSYKVFYIDSSLGLHGYVIAKEIQIKESM